MATFTVEGKTFDKYYKAYDYAMFLYNTEDRQIAVVKDGGAPVMIGDILTEDELDSANNY
jgi:hypothetical protein